MPLSGKAPRHQAMANVCAYASARSCACACSCTCAGVRLHLLMNAFGWMVISVQELLVEKLPPPKFASPKVCLPLPSPALAPAPSRPFPPRLSPPYPFPSPPATCPPWFPFPLSHATRTCTRPQTHTCTCTHACTHTIYQRVSSPFGGHMVGGGSAHEHVSAGLSFSALVADGTERPLVELVQV